jgi:hypothetical protein
MLSISLPPRSTHLVTFKSMGANKTELTVTEYDWTVGSQMLNLAEIGLKQCLSKMAASLTKA